MAVSKERGDIDPTGNVIPLFGPAPRRKWEATEDELEEYRRLKPLLLQMLSEWELVKDQKKGCPVLTNILAPD